MQVEAAIGRRVLILRAAGQPQFPPLDIERQGRDLVGVISSPMNRRMASVIATTSAEDSPGPSPAGSRRRRPWSAAGAAAGMVGHEAVVDALQQPQRLVGGQRRGGRSLPRPGRGRRPPDAPARRRGPGRSRARTGRSRRSAPPRHARRNRARRPCCRRRSRVEGSAGAHQLMTHIGRSNPDLLIANTGGVVAAA